MAETNEDFTAALNKEFGIEPETPPAADPPVADPPEGGEQAAQVPPAGDEDGDKTPPTADGEPEKQDPPVATVEEEAKPLTKEDIAAAMREYNEETAGRVEKIHSAREEIIEKLHPEGINKDIVDSNGEVIKTAQDIVDRQLINKATGDAYTYEEAASWMLQAQQQMNKNVDELNTWAEEIAEKNISLIESNQRVMAEHGDLLKKMPKVAEELAEAYITTQLEFDKTNSYIVRMGMSPEQYYKLTLAPYQQYNEAITAKEALEADIAAKQAAADAAAEQQERTTGVPPQRGESKTKSNTGDTMLDALVDELNKP